ncbi:MAG: PE-PPE domain-containing protein, partial [Mycobacterium sp.]|nr:PE-PPE domain-containing protein [Mycobacterium sp.]
MKKARTAIALAAVAAAAALPCAQPAPALASTALYMGATFNELSVPQESPEFIGFYIGAMDALYVAPTGLCGGGDAGCSPVAVYTPEQLFPLTGLRDLNFDESVAAGMANLDDCLRGAACIVTEPPYTSTTRQPLTDTDYTVLGFSQSATIATNEKAALIADPTDATVSFVLVANPNRPNGGILQRFAGGYLPVLGVSFNGATPTDSPVAAPMTTVDITRQYDFVADFPTNPLNPLALINSVFGYYLIHLSPFDIGTPVLQGQYQDSTYYLDPAETLPMLMPLQAIPLLGPLLSTVLD